MQVAGGSENPQTLIAFGAKVNALIATGEIWRLITPAFLHIGFAHLVVNSVSLLSLGARAEAQYGHARFIAIYLVAAVGGSALSFLLSPAISAGASGAIFGLGGALAVYYYRRPNDDTVSPHELRKMLAVLGANLAYGLFASGIDLWPHIGGLLAGGLLAFRLLPPRRDPSRAGDSEPSLTSSAPATGFAAEASRNSPPFGRPGARSDDRGDPGAPGIGFFGTVTRSVYSPAFYCAVPRRSLRSAISYFLLICIPVTLVTSIPVMGTLLTCPRQHRTFNS